MKYVTLKETVKNTDKSYISIYQYLNKNKKTSLEADDLSFQSPGSLTKELLLETMEQFFSNKQSDFPQEEQAIYRAGKLEETVKHLESEKELLKEENKVLSNSIKSLPAPVEKVLEKLKILQDENELLKNQIKLLPEPQELQKKDNLILYLEEENKKEKEQLEIQIGQLNREINEFKKAINSLPARPEIISDILLQNAENLMILQKEKEAVLKQKDLELRDQESRLKAQAQKEKQALEETLKNKLKQDGGSGWKFW